MANPIYVTQSASATGAWPWVPTNLMLTPPSYAWSVLVPSTASTVLSLQATIDNPVTYGAQAGGTGGALVNNPSTGAPFVINIVTGVSSNQVITLSSANAGWGFTAVTNYPFPITAWRVNITGASTGANPVITFVQSGTIM